jgi:diguanylate cyclase (GGDEF)-like protein
VANRRRFTEAMEEAVAASAKSGEPISLIMLDIDHFKKVNDTWGHAVGDDVLKDVTKRLESNIRPQDLVGRLGGEEFAILLPETGVTVGKIVAERLRAAMERHPSRTSGGPVPFTASFGGVSVAHDSEDARPDRLLALADEGLYKSKNAGRNRVSWYS